MIPLLQLALLLTALGSAETPVHKVEVHITGPLAMVDVSRTVEAAARSDGGRSTASFLDINLPDSAALLDVEIVERGHAVPVAEKSEVQANAALAAALQMKHLSLPSAPAPDESGYRIHLTPIAEGAKAILHYRYVQRVSCAAGRFVLPMPEDTSPYPLPAETRVTFDPAPGLTLAEVRVASQTTVVRNGKKRVVVQASTPAQAAWTITWDYGKPSPGRPWQVLAAGAVTKKAEIAHGQKRVVPHYQLAGAVCRQDDGRPVPPPSRAILLIDRSRSVGQGGLSAERILARSLLAALPPSIAFNAIQFGTEAVPLFRFPRIATREAMDLLGAAVDPNRLENGTDLVLGLERAGKMLDAWPDEARAASWAVIITDGALPAGQTVEKMQAALSEGRDGKVKVLVLFVRQRGDDEVPPEALSAYAQLARRFGGLVRVIPPGDEEVAGRRIAAQMGKGDLLDVRLEGSRMADVIPPLEGASILFAEIPRNKRTKSVRFSARALDEELAAEAVPIIVPAEWLEPLVAAQSGKRRAWAGAASAMAVSIMPGPVAAKKKQGGDEVVRGRMDPMVLRNALALAFMPRARACYLSRRVAKAGDAFLRGRMKLELTIERGELHDAVVKSSSLENPVVESCVRSAAFAIEYPRPEHRDSLTVANLNLVFQPRTPTETRDAAAAGSTSEVDREIDLFLGPPSTPSDYQDLLQGTTAEKSPPR